MHVVDHANPLHDQLCRCRACKPGTRRSGGRLERTRRVEVAALGLLAVGVVTLVMR